MTEDESLAEAHRILSEAGWRGIPKAPWNGRCAAPGLVGGFAPNGDQYAKAYTAFPQAMASAMGLDPADYPDEAPEAAAWLVRHVQGRTAPPAAVSTLDPVAEAEQSCVGGEEAVAQQPININVQGATVNIGDVGARAQQEQGHEADRKAVPEVDPNGVAGVERGLGIGAVDAVGGGGNQADTSSASDEHSGQKQPDNLSSETDASNTEAAPTNLGGTDGQINVHPESEAVSEPEPPPAGAVDSGASAVAEGDEGSAEAGGDSGGQGVLAPYGPDGEGDSDEGEEDILDAEFAESEIERALLEDDYIPPEEPPPQVEGGDAEFPALEEQLKDFAPEEVVPDDVAEAVAIFGDNLPMARLVLIGKITTLAAEYKAALQEGWDRNEFAYLQNWVARVAEGKADDEPVLRDRFNWVSAQSRAMSAIDAYAESQVEYINGATREQVESYIPEEGWP